MPTSRTEPMILRLGKFAAAGSTQPEKSAIKWKSRKVRRQFLWMKMETRLTMPGSLATAVISMFAGKWYDRYGVRKIYLIGTVLLLTSSAAFCFLGESTPAMYIIMANLVRSVGCGMLMMPTITWAMSKLDTKYTSDGTAIITSLRTIAGSLGAAAFTSIMTVAAQNETVAGQVFGVNVAFAVMCALTAVLFGIAVVKIK